MTPDSMHIYRRVAGIVGRLEALEFQLATLLEEARGLEAHLAGLPSSPQPSSGIPAPPPREAPITSVAPAPHPPSSSPHSDQVLSYLQRTIVDELDVTAPLTAQTDLLDVGIDSVRTVQLVQRLIEETGMEIGHSDFLLAETMGDLAVRIALKNPMQASSL